MKLLYTIAIHCYALFSAPALFKKKHRHRLTFRFPKIEKEGKPIVWIHAPSVGETRAVAPLVKKLARDYRILLSCVTQTGHAEGKRCVDASWHVYLPFDLPYLIRPIMKRVAPKLVILAETDFWFHFEDSAKKVGARLILINGKVSEKSFKRYSKLPALSRLLFTPFDLLCVQGKLYEERFCSLGIDPAKIRVTGNIKLGATFEDPLPPHKAVLTLGSTHDPEERLWIEVLKSVPQLNVYFVPRHPQRFDQVAQMLENSGLSWGRASAGATFETFQIVLVDKMGVLKQCYRSSTLAFVGGTLTPRVGGHNILEPCLYGVPVLYGPHLYNQPDLKDLIERYVAGVEVTEVTLKQTLKRLLEQSEERKALSLAGKKLIKESSGALEATYQAITCEQVLARNKEG